LFLHLLICVYIIWAPHSPPHTHCFWAEPVPAGEFIKEHLPKASGNIDVGLISVKASEGLEREEEETVWCYRVFFSFLFLLLQIALDGMLLLSLPFPCLPGGI
jgi:hypothetical protein